MIICFRMKWYYRWWVQTVEQQQQHLQQQNRKETMLLVAWLNVLNRCIAAHHISARPKLTILHTHTHTHSVSCQKCTKQKNSFSLSIYHHLIVDVCVRVAAEMHHLETHDPLNTKIIMIFNDFVLPSLSSFFFVFCDAKTAKTTTTKK